MIQAKSGDSVKVHYTGKLEDGTLFDSSEGRDPLEFVVGSKMVITGFDKGVMGMTTGEKKTITIPPDEAYGLIREDLIANVELCQFPGQMIPEVGQALQIEQADGISFSVVVVHVDDERVVLDANHPLAGKTLIFDLELVSVN